MKPYTVIGFNEDDWKTFVDHVMAKNALHAFDESRSKFMRHNAMFVVAISGHHGDELDGLPDAILHFPGEALVCSATIEEQPEIFGPDNDTEAQDSQMPEKPCDDGSIAVEQQ